jgi:hypothetical protein
VEKFFGHSYHYDVGEKLYFATHIIMMLWAKLYFATHIIMMLWEKLYFATYIIMMLWAKGILSLN